MRVFYVSHAERCAVGVSRPSYSNTDINTFTVLCNVHQWSQSGVSSLMSFQLKFQLSLLKLLFFSFS